MNCTQAFSGLHDCYRMPKGATGQLVHQKWNMSIMWLDYTRSWTCWLYRSCWCSMLSFGLLFLSVETIFQDVELTVFAVFFIAVLCHIMSL